MSFVHPELLLLIVPALWVAWRARTAPHSGGATLALRALAALLAIAAVAGAHVALRAQGRDLVLVVDRSRSMPADSDPTALEWIRLAEEARRGGDRVGVVTFGDAVQIERVPAARESFQGFQKDVSGHASRMGEALDVALTLIDEERPGSVLLLSDGESNGASPLDLAADFTTRAARIDIHALQRPQAPDVAVTALEVPAQANTGEPFQFVARVYADEPGTRTFKLERGNELLRSGVRTLERGENILVFRDVVADAGVHVYRLSLEGGLDRVPENDRGVGAVEVAGPQRVLVVNHDGREDTLTALLRRADFPVEISSPETAPIDALRLESFAVVVLENVPIGRLPRTDALRDFVLERGGGLFVTGGRASFGLGGYHLSPVDSALPVSMEMRDEQRKQGLALAIALDRSGSMSAVVASGETKMELANAGAAAAVELLSPLDAVTVFAVDMSAHEIVDAPRVDDLAGILDEVLGIEAGGGGIHTRNALDAALEALTLRSHENRHLILFADANDADAQMGCATLVDQMVAAGMTLSVVALGTQSDAHAQFLIELAQRGGGEAYFSTLAEDLPRLFAEDTLRVARSAFVEELTPVELLADVRGLGDLELSDFPAVAGFNRTWLRPGASSAALTAPLAADEPRSPLLAFGQRGLGRSAAYMGQIGGTYGAELLAWPDVATLLTSVVRYCMGDDEPLDVFVDAARSGAQGVVTLELDPETELRADLATLELRVGSPEGEWSSMLLERVSEERFEARLDLTRPGVTLGTVHLGDGRFARVPPLALSYSPEYAPELDPRRGERLMQRLAAETGGTASPLAGDLFRGERASVRYRALGKELALAALLLLLLEIAGRRLQLWGRSEVTEPLSKAEREARASHRRRARAAQREEQRALEAAANAQQDPAGGDAARTAGDRAQTADMADALERARHEAARRLRE